MESIYIEIINKYKHILKIDEILNIILVCEQVRPAFLFEFFNYGRNRDILSDLYEIIYDINSNFEKVSINKKLKYTSDKISFERIFVYLENSFVDRTIKSYPESVRDDKWIGKFLGFQCVNHDYFNTKVDRITINHFVLINNQKFPLITEVCQMDLVDIEDLEKGAYELNDDINIILNSLGFNSIYDIKITIGTNTRYQKLEEKDIKYIKKNKFEYENDFINYYISNEDIWLDSITCKKLNNIEELDAKDFNKLITIYREAAIEDKFDIFYEGSRSDEDIIETSRRIKEDDTIFWTKGDVGADNLNVLYLCADDRTINMKPPRLEYLVNKILSDEEENNKKINYYIGLSIDPEYITSKICKFNLEKENNLKEKCNFNDKFDIIVFEYCPIFLNIFDDEELEKKYTPFLNENLFKILNDISNNDVIILVPHILERFIESKFNKILVIIEKFNKNGFYVDIINNEIVFKKINEFL
jgi:hypothetical protein